MLNSPLLTVYRTDKMNSKLNLNRPLTDYFIKSSHNTYITGHQLSGTSSAKMYSLSLIEGYRLVELDCYNGSGDDVVITHGYTLTGILLSIIFLNAVEFKFLIIIIEKSFLINYSVGL